jgi:hypothetical protein
MGGSMGFHRIKLSLFLLAAVSFIVFAGCGSSQDGSDVNGGTNFSGTFLKETVAGTTLFSDDFEDGNYTGWNTNSGTWSVITDGTKVLKQSGTSASAYAYTGDAAWNDYTVSAKIKPLVYNGTDRTVALMARFQSTSNFYCVKLSNANTVSIQRKSGGQITTLATKTYVIASGTQYSVSLNLSGSSLSLYINDVLQLTATDSTFTSGKVGFSVVNASAEFDDIVVVSGTPGPSASPTASTSPSPSASPSATASVEPSASASASPTASASIPPLAEIYVSTSGSDSNTGTLSSPFYSLSKAVSYAAAGTVIYMRGGTYNYTETVNLTAVGTETNPIQIIPYENEKPVLNYSNWKPATETIRGAARGIKVTMTAQYWYLKGLEICYAPDNGVKSEGGHITFEQCVFHHNGDGGLQIGLNKDTYSSNPDPDHYAAYNYVKNCDAYRNADPATSYENADGFSCKLYAGKGNYFFGCRAWENCDDGWDLYQTDYAIVIENCWAWHNGDPSQWGFSSFNGDGNGFKLGGDSTYCPVTMKNCVAFDCNYGTTVAFAYNNNTAPITLYNCLAFNSGYSYKLKQAGNILTNCVDFRCTRPAPKDISTSSVMTNDSWTLGLAASASDFASILTSDALASRQSDGSLPLKFARLVNTSILINKGVNVGIPYLGSAPDLGAYELQ